MERIDPEAVIDKAAPTPIEWLQTRRYLVTKFSSMQSKYLARIATLETQLAEANEAVRVLGETCLIINSSGNFIRRADAWSEMMKNPLARASVEKAGKANE